MERHPKSSLKVGVPGSFSDSVGVSASSELSVRESSSDLSSVMDNMSLWGDLLFVVSGALFFVISFSVTMVVFVALVVPRYDFRL